MAGLQPPRVADKLVPVFTPEELSRLEQACAGRSFTQRRDTAVIAVLTATGIRLSELAGDLRSGDLDLWQREITVRGKGGKDRIVKIGHQAARSLDRYLRARSRHAHARQPQLWLGVNNREPLTAAGIYQMIARRGRQCGVDAFPHRFRHHFSHTWLDRGGPEGDLMELNGWSSPADAPPLRRQRPQRPRPPHLRPHHDRHIRSPPSAVPVTPAPHQIRGRTHPGSSGTRLSLGSIPAAPGMCPDAPTAQHESGQQAISVRPWRPTGERQPLSPDTDCQPRGPSREPAPGSRAKVFGRPIA